MLNCKNRVLVEDVGYIRPKNFNDTKIWNGEQFAEIENVESKQVVKVEFKGGHSIVCSAGSKLLGKHNRIWTPASDFKSQNVILGASALPEFNYIELADYKYLKHLNSYSVGMVIGFTKIFAQNNIYTLHFRQTELRKMLEHYLTGMRISFTTQEIEAKTVPIIKYTIDTEDLKTECESLINREGFNPVVWQSKPLLKGFLQVLVSSALVENDSLTFKASRKFCKDVQEALLAFAVNSYTTKGLIKDYVTITRKSFPMLAKNIGTLDLNTTLKFYDNNFLTQKSSVKRLTFKVRDVTITDEYVKMFDIQGGQIVSNGLLIKQQ